VHPRERNADAVGADSTHDENTTTKRRTMQRPSPPQVQTPFMHHAYHLTY